MRVLGAFDLRSILRELADELARRHAAPMEVLVVGGAAMALLFQGRRTTADVDVIDVSDETRIVLFDAAACVAERLSLNSQWLSDNVQRFRLSGRRGRVVFDHGPLRLIALAPEVLLAMKLRAYRFDQDRDDAVVLLNSLLPTHSGIEGVWNAIAVLLPVGEHRRLRSIFEEVLESAGHV